MHFRQTGVAKFKKKEAKRQTVTLKMHKRQTCVAKLEKKRGRNAKKPNMFGEIQKDKRQKTTRFGEMRKKRGQKDKP